MVPCLLTSTDMLNASRRLSALAELLAGFSKSVTALQETWHMLADCYYHCLFAAFALRACCVSYLQNVFLVILERTAAKSATVVVEIFVPKRTATVRHHVLQAGMEQTAKLVMTLPSVFTFRIW